MYYIPQSVTGGSGGSGIIVVGKKTPVRRVHAGLLQWLLLSSYKSIIRNDDATSPSYACFGQIDCIGTYYIFFFHRLYTWRIVTEVSRENEKTNCPSPSSARWPLFFDTARYKSSYARVAVVNPPPSSRPTTTKIRKTYTHTHTHTNKTSTYLYAHIHTMCTYNKTDDGRKNTRKINRRHVTVCLLECADCIL